MLEDIHSVGLKYIHMDHKVFGMVTSNIRFREREVLARYLRAMSERIGRPVSDNKPIIDGALLDGSRINIIFSTTCPCSGRRSPSVSSLKRRFHRPAHQVGHDERSSGGLRLDLPRIRHVRAGVW